MVFPLMTTDNFLLVAITLDDDDQRVSTGAGGCKKTKVVVKGGG